MRAARLILIVLATTWIVLLATAPTSALGVPVSAMVYAFGSLICHQRPERSFHIGLAQLPVCARCYGLYLGAAVGALAALRPPAGTRLKTRPYMRRLVLACAVPTVVTWGSEVLGLWEPANVTRFVAALPLGVAVALTVNYVECARPPQNTSRPPRTPT